MANNGSASEWSTKEVRADVRKLWERKNAVLRTGDKIDQFRRK